jgi:hypothetical protein
MKKKFVVFFGVAFLVAIAAPNLFAEGSNFALSAKAGTLGLGLEGSTSLNPNFNARVGANTFSYDYGNTASGIKYDVDLKLLTLAGLVDWFPFSNGLRLSAGAMVNYNELDMNATSSSSYEIGGTTYTPADVGTLSGNLDFNRLAPYLGVGFGNPFEKDSSWSFNFDLGVLFQGSPDLSVSTTGALATNAAFQADLEKEKQDLKNTLNEFKYYPVISFGITYRF